MNDLKIKMKDFGPIPDTDLEIKRITVIKSEENREKLLTIKLLKISLSTLAYGTYQLKKDIASSIIDSRYKILEENYYLAECLSIINSVLRERKKGFTIQFIERWWNKALNLIDEYQPKFIRFEKCVSIYKKEILEKHQKVFDIFIKKVFDDKDEFECIIKANENLLKMFREEESNNIFFMNKYKYFKNAKIEFTGTLFDKKIDSIFEIKDEECEISINEEFLKFFNPNEIICICQSLSDEFQFESGPSRITDEVYHSHGHKFPLFEKTDSIERIMNTEFKEFYKIIGGRFFKEERGEIKFKAIEKDDDLFKNHPSGMNTLAKLQLLYENEFLEKDSILILDNVEYYLIPKWQDKLAQLLVSLVKELKISICIFSSNDDFIKSIEKYSMEYGLIEESRFYLKRNFNEVI